MGQLFNEINRKSELNRKKHSRSYQNQQLDKDICGVDVGSKGKPSASATLCLQVAAGGAITWRGNWEGLRARQSLTASRTTRIKTVAQNNSEWQTGLSLHGRLLKSPHLFLIK